eukprot:CAMPEP_0202057042 /NCGR_PEP_ID=MMETSP0963-20130614/26762_1 /ASSEMBLY_ACC=CAM_ASM_000494 /TAXON_ID=4773 /ORGANISM="Schizochytrium aggregatum, Strain ATCC28209" /LENGTH=52 /DNA_ID=CAMNT_0048622853 /DNA_START=367 /DNA_END=521 /DNA_ORIENTATION=-
MQVSMPMWMRLLAPSQLLPVAPRELGGPREPEGSLRVITTPALTLTLALAGP